MTIYFAASIRGGREDATLYAEIIHLLKTYGEVLTEHIGDATLSASGGDVLSDTAIYERDLSWLESADYVVAEVTRSSLGVGYELGKAEGKKPVLCVYREIEGKKLSAMIAGNKNFEIACYETVGDLKKIFERFFE